MNGKCDTCGEPAGAKCDAPGCSNEMCEAHAARKRAPVLDIDNPPEPNPQVFCPEHAHLAIN